jgi:hypothetical protein
MKLNIADLILSVQERVVELARRLLQLGRPDCGVPAKDLCRSRALCWVWRALTSDPFFAAAHKSHQTAPLLALAYHDNNEHTGVEIVDLSGNVLRRIPGIESDIDSLNQW